MNRKIVNLIVMLGCLLLITNSSAIMADGICGAGTTWNGSQCVADSVFCGAGTVWNGSQCIVQQAGSSQFPSGPALDFCYENQCGGINVLDACGTATSQCAGDCVDSFDSCVDSCRADVPG